MNPSDPVGALVERTLHNLELFEEMESASSSEARPFEVTQLVNSLLSLLVVPRELGTVEFVGRSSHTPHVSATGIDRWRGRSIRFELQGLESRPPQHLRKLLGGLRNSVAHASFEFVPNAEGEIGAIKFTHCSRSGAEQWSVSFAVTELRKFIVALAVELRAAREHQLARPAGRKDMVGAAKTDVTFQLPLSTLERVQALVAAGEASSVGRFIELAVVARLLDDEEFTAA